MQSRQRLKGVIMVWKFPLQRSVEQLSRNYYCLCKESKQKNKIVERTILRIIKNLNENEIQTHTLSAFKRWKRNNFSAFRVCTLQSILFLKAQLMASSPRRSVASTSSASFANLLQTFHFPICRKTFNKMLNLFIALLSILRTPA